MMYTEEDKKREYYDYPDCYSKYEDSFESDCNRLIHSPSFRRLQGKIQLFPIGEYDFFRNRLTHSLEVSAVAELIVNKLNSDINFIEDKINKNAVRFACLAHDLGHPPFGHAGENALNSCMAKFGGFEGNAQTLRILTKIEKGNIIYNSSEKHARFGLNLTYRSIASIVKTIEPIPEKIPLKDNSKTEYIKKRGYYKENEGLIKKIFGDKRTPTIECQIMDIADDIANAIYDLEDSLKGGFFNPFDLFFPYKETILPKIVHHLKEKKEKGEIPNNIEIQDSVVFNALIQIFESSEILTNSELPKDDWIKLVSFFYNAAMDLSSNGYARNKFIKRLVNRFVDAISHLDFNNPNMFSKVHLKDNELIQIIVLKKFHEIYQHHSTNTVVSDYRGARIIKRLFSTLTCKPELMSKDFYNWHESENNKKRKARIICDYIAGMTDNYCIEFYSRIFSEKPQSYFKPI